MTDLAENLRAVRARIDAAARAAGRDPSSVALLAVSKTWPADDVRALAALGQLDFGENRAQELVGKAAELADLAAALALHRPAAAQQGRGGGPARRGRALRRPDVPGARARPGRAGAASRPVEVLVQVDLGGAAGGARGPRRRRARTTCPALADLVAGCAGLRLRGLMAVAPRGEDPRPAFERLAALAGRVRADHPEAVDAVGGHERRPRGGGRSRRDRRACRNRVVRGSPPSLRRENTSHMSHTGNSGPGHHAGT